VSNTSMSVRRLADHVSGYVLGGFETRTCDARTLRNCSAFPYEFSEFSRHFHTHHFTPKLP
ncbi:MAG: hypothetical protein FWF12_08270, partial [Betaproteobacteria bacterium]|nr:hypothetical protein [Betaproteobacteria bacterium]